MSNGSLLPTLTEDPQSWIDSSLLSGNQVTGPRHLKAYQPWAFFITFGGYFMVHFSRKSYSTVKHSLQDIAGYPTWVLSAMDTIFMATYAAGNIINGKLGDTFNPTHNLAIGLLGSGFCLILINVAIWLDFYHSSAFFAVLYIEAVYFCFGFFQATGGQVGTAVTGNCFSDAESVKNRGLIFGFWTCHQYMGDITAGLCTALILKIGLPYWWALTIPALSNIAWAFLTAQLVADPTTVGIVTPELNLRMEKLEAKRKELAEKGEEMIEDEGPNYEGEFVLDAHHGKGEYRWDNGDVYTGDFSCDRRNGNGNIYEGDFVDGMPITFAAALAIPMVARYALAFGFFKLTNYVLFFWLPYFLGNHLDDSTANLIALLYSVGMMPGGVIVGYVSDLFGGRRAVVIGTFMLTLMFFLAFLAAKSESGMKPATLLFLLGCMGILVGGPDNIITSAVAADLASHPSIRGNNKSLGTVTGLINGTGSITASIGLMAIGPLSDNYGWGSVWLFLMACTATGTLLMSKKIYSELFPANDTSSVIV